MLLRLTRDPHTVLGRRYEPFIFLKPKRDSGAEALDGEKGDRHTLLSLRLDITFSPLL